MKNIIKIILVSVILFSGSGYAQSVIKADNLKSDAKSDSAFVMTKSPWGAVLRSAIIPGWGQYYNESYWKIPLFAGAVGGLIYGWSYYNTRYNKYIGLYNNSKTSSTDVGNSAFKQQRDFYRDQRDLMSIYIGLTYLLNLIDAYVDAQLFDFTVKENSSTLSPEVNMKFYFNR